MIEPRCLIRSAIFAGNHFRLSSRSIKNDFVGLQNCFVAKPVEEIASRGREPSAAPLYPRSRRRSRPRWLRQADIDRDMRAAPHQSRSRNGRTHRRAVSGAKRQGLVALNQNLVSGTQLVC